jgi:arylsulfatase A-like enzyme
MKRLSRRKFMQGAMTASTLGLLGIGTIAQAKQGRAHPNLVFVFPDQMRGQALGFMDQDPVITPHLDRFARESLVLTQAVSNYPVCSPFRAMLMTGTYPHANRVITNCTSRTEPVGCELQTSDRCWSDVLKDQGYSLGYIGKWHLDSPRPPYIDCKNNRGPLKWNEWCAPARRHGFDFWHAYGTYDYHMNPMYWDTTAPRKGFHFVDQWGPEHEADLAIDYIKNTGGQCRKPDRPFALVVSMNPPHTPYNQFPPRYLEPYADKSAQDLLVRPNVDTAGQTKMSQLALKQTKNYFANVTGVDEQFGRILHALDEANLTEDTIVVFTSDHGNCLGTHGQATKNNLYEESMRIPFIIRWPGKIRSRHDDLLMSVPDIYPTLMELAGYRDMIPATVQGTSHAGLFLNGTGRRPTAQLYLKIPFDQPSYGLRGIRTHQYKLIVTAIPDRPLQYQLFDLKSDPYEMSDIAAQRPELVQRLILKELYPRLKQTNDPWIRHIRRPSS